MPWQKLLRFGMLFTARIAGAASLFAVNLLIVRFLGIEALGNFAVFVSLTSIIAVILASGFTAIAPVLAAEYSAKQQQGLLKGFVITAVKQGAVLFSLIAAGFLAFWYSGAEIPFLENHSAGLAMLVTAIASAFVGFNGAVLIGMKKQIAGTVPETFFRPISFLLLSTVLMASGFVADIDGVYWLLAASTWITLLFVLFRDRKLRDQYSEIQQIRDQNRWRKASFPWMGITLLWDFMIDLVLLLTSLLAGSVEIAILHICFRYRVLAGFGMRTLHNLMMPEITEETVSGNRSGIQKKLFQLNVTSLVYSMGVLACFATFGGLLLGMFSASAVGAVSVLLTISATMIVRAIFGPAPMILAIHGFHMITLITSLICSAAALAFVWATFGQFGIMAAAVGYTGANVLISSILWRITLKKTGIDCSVFSGVKNLLARFIRTSSNKQLPVSNS
ncbi:MAG: hypothetical protein AAGA53_08145 [Pseudomonadota bacterium]